MTGFDRALGFVLKEEGGYANVTGDRGGETYKGIARNSNPNWSGWIKINALKTSGITNPQELTNILNVDNELQTAVADLYKSKYWIPIHGDDLPWPVDCSVFDCSVNSGPHEAIKLLQNALTIIADGIIGSATLTEVAKWVPSNLVGKYIAIRKQFYQTIVNNDESQARFLIGWLSRLDNLSKFISETV